MKDKFVTPAEMAEQIECINKIKAQNDAYFAEKSKQKRAFVLTFGCQQNEADSEKIMGLARAMGYAAASTPEEADLIVVNTCAIREHAEQKALSTIGQYKHVKAKNPDLIIGVCGCMVAQEHRRDDIKFKYPYVSFTLGTASLHRMPSVIWENIVKNKRIYCPEETEYRVAEGIPSERESTYRAWVSVMYGCNNFCSYCIVPYVRGRERSRKMEDILVEVRELVEKGYRDITLLGQNVNSYGKDFGAGYDFADLLSEIDKIDGDYLIRFMTSHPKDATKKLIDVMADSRHVARQFHLPIQSGSDEVLKAMNRKYDTKKYLETLDYIREKMPDAAVTTDIIVGFPGESDEDFEGTLDILRRAKFDMIFSFIYSPRKGTPAAEMHQVPEEIKKARFARLLEVQNAISYEKNQPLYDKTVRVLCDGISKNNGDVYSGRTEGNKIVFFDGEPEDTGKFLNIHVSRADTFALYGEKV